MYWPYLSDIIMYSYHNVAIPAFEWYMTLMIFLLRNMNDPVTGDCVIPYEDPSCLNDCKCNNLKSWFVFISLHIIIMISFVQLMKCLINVLGPMMKVFLMRLLIMQLKQETQNNYFFVPGV